MPSIQAKSLSQTELNHWDNLQRSGRYFACREKFAAAHRQCMTDKDGQDQTLVSIGLKSGLFRGQYVEAFFDFRAKARKTWRVLEIGAGYGGYAPLIAPYVKTYIGTDISGYIVAKGNMALVEVGLDNAALVHTPDSDLIKALGPDVRFEFIFASGVFIHLPVEIARAYLEQISKLLTPKGKFMVHLNLFDDSSADNDWEPAYETRKSHRMRYGAEGFRQLFEDSGLEIEKQMGIILEGQNFHAHYVYGGLAPKIEPEQTIIIDREEFGRFAPEEDA